MIQLNPAQTNFKRLTYFIGIGGIDKENQGKQFGGVINQYQLKAEIR